MKNNSESFPIICDESEEDCYEAMPKPFLTNYSNIYDFYLTGDVGDSKNFIQWFHQIRNARETDLIRIHINSCGGDLLTTIQLISCMQESPAKVIGFVEGACMSAATMIFLACDDHDISKHSSFLFHNYSGGVIGKGGEMYSSMVHQRKWSDTLMSEFYEHILTPEEIEGLLDDKDVWLDRDEMIERLENREKKREEIRETAEKTVRKTTKRKTTKRKTTKK